MNKVIFIAVIALVAWIGFEWFADTKVPGWVKLGALLVLIVTAAFKKR